MPVCRIVSGVVVQRWEDVRDVAQLADKYGLSGADYAAIDAFPGQLWDGTTVSNPEAPAKTQAEIEAEVQDVADDLVQNEERLMSLALATVDLAIATDAGQLAGRTKAQIRQLFRNRVVDYLRQKRGL